MGNASQIRVSAFAQWFEHAFLRFGAGGTVFKPIISAGWWNRASWVLIAIGIAGWAAALWLLRGYAELP